MAAETAPQVTVDSIVERFRTPTPRPATPTTPDVNPLPASDDVQAALGRVRDRYEIPYSGTRVPAVGPAPDVVLGLAEGASDAELPNVERPEPARANFGDRVREGLRHFFADPYRWIGRAGGVFWVEGMKYAVTINGGREAGLLSAYIAGLTGGGVGVSLEQWEKRTNHPRLRQLAFGFAEGSLATAAIEAAMAGLTAAGINPDSAAAVVAQPPKVPGFPGPGVGPFNGGGANPTEISVVVKQGDTLSELTKRTLHLSRPDTYAHIASVVKDNAAVLREYALSHGKTEVVAAIDWTVNNVGAPIRDPNNWRTIMKAGSLISPGMNLKFQ